MWDSEHRDSASRNTLPQAMPIWPAKNVNMLDDSASPVYREAAIRDGRLEPAVPGNWIGLEAEIAHAAGAQSSSKTPLLHAWPLCHADTWAADAAWLCSMRQLGFPLVTVDASGRTLLHRAVQVQPMPGPCSRCLRALRTPLD